MSLDHKAFSFDWNSFQRELAPRLSAALRTNDPAKVICFVDANLTSCKTPYDGEPLDSDWRELLEAGDVQEVGDLALTKYYDPASDNGLSESWAEIEAEVFPAVREALLGTPFGDSDDAVFDPGRMGSYFQSPKQVRESVAVLKASAVPELTAFIGFLEDVAGDSRGLYVTF